MFRSRLALTLGTLLPVALLTLGLLGCSDNDTTAPPTSGETGEIVPDFSITDVNATSATAGQAVSPRDYLEKVSAWYFGHAT